MAAPSDRLIKLGLAMLVASTTLAGPTSNKLHRRCGEPSNSGFEAGNLQGWQVLSGNAWGDRSVSDVASYWDGPFHKDGKYFLLGTAQAGETAVGEIRSASFKAGKVMSFLVSGGYDPTNLYVALVRDSDGQILLKQTGINDEAFIRIIWDTSKWSGEAVHIVVHDSAAYEHWGHINFDDLRVGEHALGDGDLTFHVLGQANQAPANSEGACSLYAKDTLRPQYHYTPYQGWINDPAGLVQYKGRHHLFSQYYPTSPLWGPMHWSHAESTDAVHWRELPVALYPKPPAQAGDESGRFTGSAMVDRGELHLVFTDYTDLRYHPGAVQENVIVASSKDGVNFTLSERNPVIPGPPAGAPAFFRDPKVFRDPIDNSWKMAIGATTSDNKGQVQLYRGTDAFTWSHVGVLYTGDGTTGGVWECPNFFPLGNKWVLFYGGNAVGIYEIGTYDGKTFKSEKRGLLDAGPASYAMQWYKDQSGRDLAITWMGNWPTPKWPSRANGWAGQQSITRELFLRADGGLGSRPIAELDKLASGPVKKLDKQQVGDQPVSLFANASTARLKLTIDLGATAASSFTLSLFQSRAEATLLTYEKGSRVLRLDTTNAGYGQPGKWEAVLGAPANNKLALDIFLDRSVLEVYAGDGTVFSAAVFPRYKESTGISLVASGGTVAVGSVSLTPLGSSWC
jgi:sucrose-6-phosphate hydrolase SacC (GH32 family)